MESGSGCCDTGGRSNRTYSGRGCLKLARAATVRRPRMQRAGQKFIFSECRTSATKRNHARVGTPMLSSALPPAYYDRSCRPNARDAGLTLTHEPRPESSLRMVYLIVASNCNSIGRLLLTRGEGYGPEEELLASSLNSIWTQYIL